MAFKNTFCPSPWFHMRINNGGYYEYCRWQDKSDRNSTNITIADMPPTQFFQNEMSDFRKRILNNKCNECTPCYLMEQHSKISGRQRQLLKIGVDVDNFNKSVISSPWFDEINSSIDNGNYANFLVDLQIDLGNYCDGACLFCTPNSSSKLASEWKKLNLIDELPMRSWCDNKNYLKIFIDDFKKIPNIQYMHFIGGETLITPAFKIILQAIIDANLNDNITIGFTTNLMSWNESVCELLSQFKQVNLGISIETFNEVNEYIRWPIKYENSMQIFSKWLEVAKRYNWLIQCRITPTILSVMYLDTIYNEAMKHNISVESCDFFDNPKFMRPSVLTAEYRLIAIDKLQTWVDNVGIQISNTNIINTRNPHHNQQQLMEDAQSYINYLKEQEDESWRLPDLVNYIKIMEGSRKNKILDYLPEYEELIRSAGY